MSADILPLSPAAIPEAFTRPAPPTATMPSARQMNDFAQWMNAVKPQQHASEAIQKIPVPSLQSGALSESTALLGALRAEDQEIRKRFQPEAIAGAQDTITALKIQSDVAMGVLKMELLTKVTNGIAQGINKLTSMA